MNKFYYAIIWVLLVGIGLVFALPSRKHHENTTTVWVQNTLVNVSGDDIMTDLDSGTINPLVYTNTEYGFELTLPKWWWNYIGLQYNMDDNPWFSGMVAKIDINLPTHSPRPWVEDPNDINTINSMKSWYTTWTIKYIKWYAQMISIVIRTHEGYEKAKMNDPRLSTSDRGKYTRWKNSKYVYSVNMPNDMPDDLRKNHGFWSYYNNIKNGFKLLN